jgi:hypothetical protein
LRVGRGRAPWYNHYAVPKDGELILYENQTTGAGHWLQLKLHGAGPGANGSNRDAIGALVKVTVGGLTMMRQVTGGSGHGQDSGVLHFGLDSATTADEVQIFWPSGRVDHWVDQAADVRVTVVEDPSGPAITSPVPGGLLPGADVTFDWTDGGSGATDWSLQLGSSLGASDLFDSGALGSATTVNATGLPTDGIPIFARLHFTVGGSPDYQDFEFTAALANQSPSVAITAPADGTTVTTGQVVDFSGTADDPEDGVISSSLSWASNVQGPIGSGDAVSIGLSNGLHTVAATVTDSGGVSRSEDVIVIVQGAGGNASPVVTIDAPADGHSVSSGTPIDFDGTASDAEDGDLTGDLIWTSNLFGTIGAGGSFTATLIDGTHTVTASVTDSGSLNGSESITVNVGNITPSVTITSPTQGTIAPSGTVLSFEGTASDPEDGDLTASLVWTSDLDGAIGAGGSFSTTLSDGTHTVIASATDSGALTGSSSVTVTLSGAGGPPTDVTFTSIAAEDGTVAELQEANDVGGLASPGSSQQAALRVGDDAIDRQYKTVVSFDTSSIPDGALISSAVVRLYRARGFGTSPFDTHGPCYADVQTGGFGGDPALVAGDFEAPATAPQAATMSSPAANGTWSEGVLDAAGLAVIDPQGTTQLRVECSLSDDDDGVTDQIGFTPGEGAVGTQPELVVTYE